MIGDPAPWQPDATTLAEQGWAALPASYRMPERTPTLAEAQQYCRELAESHYENFHVASWFLPTRLRPHFHSIYAYCRISDDLGDEVGSHAQALALLDVWQEQLDACYRGEAKHPVFVALRGDDPYLRYPQGAVRGPADCIPAGSDGHPLCSMADVLQYCRYSANPVGRLVLYACGYRDAERFALSDETCSALQLANFWQDVREDFARGRIYLPLDAMRAAGVNETTIAGGQRTPAFRTLLQGAGCLYPSDVRTRREAYRHGGSRAGGGSRFVHPRRSGDSSRRSRCANYDVLSAGRPYRSPAKRCCCACAGWPLRAWNAARRYDGLTQPHAIDEAYAECRAIARREAKNFYYAFVALPLQKRDAMCAIYAFMRHADDISDDESKDRADTARRVGAMDGGMAGRHRQNRSGVYRGP